MKQNLLTTSALLAALYTSGCAHQKLETTFGTVVDVRPYTGKDGNGYIASIKDEGKTYCVKRVGNASLVGDEFFQLQQLKGGETFISVRGYDNNGCIAPKQIDVVTPVIVSIKK